MRSVAPDRKNCRFMGPEDGGKTAANTCTMNQTAKFNSMDTKA